MADPTHRMEIRMGTLNAALLLFAVGLALGQVPASAVNDDEQAVRKVIADFGDAWNKHDPDAILALFTDGADWVNVAGNWWHGQAEHRRGTTWVHEHVFRNAHGHIGPVVVRFPTEDTAVAIFTHDVESFVLPDGTRNPGGNHRLSFFLVKRKGHWLITSGQNTEIKPEALNPAKQ
jgi:uncharacterized protein (TIGR02246 family)